MSQTQAPATTEDRGLLGVSIGITSDRRSEDMIASLARKGARLVHAPTMRIVPLGEDEQLLAETRDVVADPPDVVLVTTGIGLRGWVETADAAGLGAALLQTLGRARVVARGPKATGVIRANGLREAWSAASEQTAEAVQRLLDEGVAGRSVVVQLHGAADAHQLQPLLDAGARVRGVEVYRWQPPADPEAVVRLVDQIADRRLDAVMFTSAPGVVALLEAARERDRLAAVLAAFADDVVACAVGDVTAEPLRAHGLAPLIPERWRLGAQLRTLTAHLAAHPLAAADTPAGRLLVRAGAAVLDGEVVELGAGPLALLRALVEADGDVVGREQLLARLPGAADPHTVEVTIGRLRAALPAPDLVRTVVKRGYRLATAEPATS
ncbi:uroporphyrinogen-III synthase [Kineococcus gynurae]|uniref:Uroporphyrinogen-III synthase n=1 Tax=Kineococcus gynurae TaxID=452979 RepID=A0ABV5LVU6_9ACTN